MGKRSGAKLKALVTDLITGWSPQLRKVIEECPADTAAVFPFLAAERPTLWEPSSVTVLGDAMPPAGGNGANTALRDAHLLTRELKAAGNDHGFEAVDLALAILRQGLNSDPFTLFGPRPWFRLCAAVPALRRMRFKDSWAKVTRPRSWELAS